MALLIAWLGWLLLACCGVQGQVSRESDAKAVFLLSFAQFIDWPPEAFQHVRRASTAVVMPSPARE
jgi:hypothetical protein